SLVVVFVPEICCSDGIYCIIVWYPYLTGSFVVAMDSVADSQRTLYPYVTGSSVVAIKYKDGILMAADMGGLMLNLFNTY
ncbi:proteasome subunit beta type, partial [Trifolium pratense]